MMEQPIFSFPPIIDHDTQVLLLGSMPGVESLRQHQYYAHPRNQFWDILYTLFAEEKAAGYAERIAFLKAHQIGLWDVLYSCYRQGSLDANIKQEQPNDLATLLRDHPQIRFVGFNGAKALQSFKKMIGLDALSGIAYQQLPSTSPIPGRNIKTFAEKVCVWEIIRKYIT
jgi:hypoxanthine-DNA glycosylase